MVDDGLAATLADAVNFVSWSESVGGQVIEDYEVRTEVIRHDRQLVDNVAELPVGAHEPLSVDLVAQLEDLPPDAVVEVSASIPWEGANPVPSIPRGVHRAVAEGRVFDHASELAERVRLHSLRVEAGIDRLAPVLEYIEGAQGEVVDANAFALTFTARISAGALWGFAGAFPNANVDITRPFVEDCEPEAPDWGFTIDGRELSRTNQFAQFYNAGYNGLGVHMGMYEPDGDRFFVHHPGFNDNAGTPRVVTGECQLFGFQVICFSTWDPDMDASNGANQHATATASVLLGSLAQGQDPAIPQGSPRIRRSGVARRATLAGLGETTGYPLAMLHFTDPVVMYRAVNMSASEGGTCTGAGPHQQSADALFESGVPFFKSASNNEPTSPTCNIGVPGDAIGAFTVGAYTWETDPDPEDPDLDSTCFDTTPPCDILRLSRFSSTGGVQDFNDNRSRTMVDMVAPMGFQYPYPHYDRPFIHGTSTQVFYRAPWWSPLLPNVGVDFNPDGKLSRREWGAYIQTSSTAPQVAAFAVLYRQYYLDVIGSNVTDPASMYVNLLLMGDRSTSPTMKSPNLYSPTWGAGRLRARLWSNMDTPARFVDGSIPVPHGNTVDVPIRPSGAVQPLPSGVNYVKLVTWHYDSDYHDSPTTHLDRVRVTLFRSTDNVNWVPRNGDWSPDNKHRVFDSGTDLGGYYYKATIEGFDVQSDDQCGTNCNRVYYAWEYSNNDRDTPGLPQCFVPEY